MTEEKKQAAGLLMINFVVVAFSVAAVLGVWWVANAIRDGLANDFWPVALKYRDDAATTAVIQGARAEWGQLGDYFGGMLNPIFGFLSLMALLITLAMQRVELRQSREALLVSHAELKLSREAQAAAADALKSQNTAIQLQSFEQTFFSMVRLLGDVVEEFVGYRAADRFGDTELLQGRRALNYYVDQLADHIGRGANQAPQNFVPQVQGSIDSLLQQDKAGHVERYARTLTTLLNLLKHQGVKHGELHSQTLRGLLSGNELLLIYYLCFDEKWAELKRRVEEYGVLANLNHRETGAGADFASFFSRTAFLR